METQHIFNDIEEKFFNARGGLRKLRGGIDMAILSIERDIAEGFESKESKDLKFMRRMVNTCISHLDRYEDMREFNEEFEKSTLKLIALTGRSGNEHSE